MMGPAESLHGETAMRFQWHRSNTGAGGANTYPKLYLSAEGNRFHTREGCCGATHHRGDFYDYGFPEELYCWRCRLKPPEPLEQVPLVTNTATSEVFQTAAEKSRCPLCNKQLTKPEDLTSHLLNDCEVVLVDSVRDPSGKVKSDIDTFDVVRATLDDLRARFVRLPSDQHRCVEFEMKMKERVSVFAPLLKLPSFKQYYTNTLKARPHIDESAMLAAFALATATTVNNSGAGTTEAALQTDAAQLPAPQIQKPSDAIQQHLTSVAVSGSDLVFYTEVNARVLKAFKEVAPEHFSVHECEVRPEYDELGYGNSVVLVNNRKFRFIEKHVFTTQIAFKGQTQRWQYCAAILGLAKEGNETCTHIIAAVPYKVQPLKGPERHELMHRNRRAVHEAAMDCVCRWISTQPAGVTAATRITIILGGDPNYYGSTGEYAPPSAADFPMHCPFRTEHFAIDKVCIGFSVMSSLSGVLGFVTHYGRPTIILGKTVHFPFLNQSAHPNGLRVKLALAPRYCDLGPAELRCLATPLYLAPGYNAPNYKDAIKAELESNANGNAAELSTTAMTAFTNLVNANKARVAKSRYFVLMSGDFHLYLQQLITDQELSTRSQDVPPSLHVLNKLMHSHGFFGGTTELILIPWLVPDQGWCLYTWQRDPRTDWGSPTTGRVQLIGFHRTSNDPPVLSPEQAISISKIHALLLKWMADFVSLDVMWQLRFPDIKTVTWTSEGAQPQVSSGRFIMGKILCSGFGATMEAIDHDTVRKLLCDTETGAGRTLKELCVPL